MQILLIEDNILWKNQILAQLDYIGYSDVIHCQNIDSIMHFLLDCTPHLIIADVILEKHTTIFSILSKFPELHKTPIIFITSSEDPSFLELSMSFANSSYLIKPFHAISLQAAIQKKIEPINKINTDTTIDVRDKYGVKIALHSKQILYLQSDKTYCKIYTSKYHSFLLKKSMHLVKDKLGDHFQKIHKSISINQDKISIVNFRKMSVELEGEITLPIGKFFKKSLQNHMSLLHTKMNNSILDPNKEANIKS